MNWTYNFEVMSTAPSEDENFFYKTKNKTFLQEKGRDWEEGIKGEEEGLYED